MAEDLVVLKISQILDRTTVIVAGSGVNKIRPLEDLVVVAVGQPVFGTQAPLVVPKARLEATVITEHYLIARPPVTNQASLLSVMDSMKKGRSALTVSDEDLQGNPGQEPVRVGDIVLRADEISDYVTHLVKEQGARTT